MSTLYSSGKTYTKTAPNGPDSYPDTGDAELTNGSVASAVYSDAAWVGWYQTNVTVTIDLGVNRQMSEVRFHYFHSAANSIYDPSALAVQGSTDNTNWTTVGSFVRTTHWATTDGARWSNTLPVIQMTVRYVKFTFTYDTPNWIFLSELEVYGSAGGGSFLLNLI